MSSSLFDKLRGLKQRTWRRRHPRYRADFPLKATALRDDGYTEILGRSSDIGLGGLGTVLNGEVPAGEVVSLEMRLSPSLHPMAVRAIVRYRRGFTHGFEFLGLSNEHRVAIEDFCAALKRVD
jgi:PilZ domain